ncbi:thioesterase II family protein [Xenorhabdus szentirmaii]|uniref:thioesterase II family protein n=1 Tax=Xenorhabdus szentirmaii TaxID=290112 RepID=UPI0019B51EA9|nr:alpha/beta fold hydrolase [Xenorhabdus sp. 5]MBD2825550.1 alpha/beta fold hydrolase [Xenorhabdus sp. 5]
MNNLPHLAMFHHAGGNAAALSHLAKTFASDFDVIQFEMPGRGRRRREPLVNDATQIVDDFAALLPPREPIIFLGHSLGAYIAYLMAAYCQASEPARQIMLVVVANHPIHCRQQFSFLDSAQGPSEQLVRFASQLGQLPDWLQQEPLLLEQFLHVLAADLRVANSISPSDTAPLRDIPLLAIHSTEDPLLQEPPWRWQECTQQVFELVSISGGHFISAQQGEKIREATLHFIQKYNLFKDNLRRQG